MPELRQYIEVGRVRSQSKELNQNTGGSSAFRATARVGADQAAMPCLGTTVTIHRVGLLDLSSLTERIMPVTGTPFKIILNLSPRYWA